MQSSSNVQIRCNIYREDDELVVMKIVLTDKRRYITTLEFADITNDYLEFVEVNNHIELYDSEDELQKELAEAYLNKFLNRSQENTKMDLLVNLRMKMLHQASQCRNNCILCNPDLGDDPFPDFTFDLKNYSPEGEA